MAMMPQLMMLMVLPLTMLMVLLLTMLMVPLQMRDPVLTMMNMEVAQPQMMLMVHQLRNMVLPQMMLMVLPLLRSMVLQLTMLMVPLQRDPVLHLMTIMLRFHLMLMLLPRHLHLPMKMLDAAVLVEDLAELLLNKLLVVDVQGTLEEGLIRDPPQPKRHQELDVNNKHKDVDADSSPSQSHTEDQGGTPLPSDIR